MALFAIGDHDYSEFIATGGLSPHKAERGLIKTELLDGSTRKHRASLKDEVAVTLAMVPDAVYLQLVEDLSAVTFQASYRAQEGEVTKVCACDTGAVGAVLAELDDGLYWASVALTIYEV